MGLFNRKKKENKKVVKPTEIMVSAKELMFLIDLAIEAIDPYQIEYEIEFNQGEQLHKIGIDYNRSCAPKKGYFPEFMTVYLNDQVFKSLQDMCEYGEIDGKKFVEYEPVFSIDPMYETPLQTGDIIDYTKSVWYGPRH